METRGSPRGRALTVLGAPAEAGASLAGAAMGPAMPRVAGLGYEVEDSGDLALSRAEPAVAPPNGPARHAAETGFEGTRGGRVR
ncbi:MAG: hypothetical protein ABR929_10045 [Roseiarcus sp.]|jgi:hypothetical protein